MRVLVTGANGFIGSNLAKHLLSKGLTVNALVRKSSNLDFLRGLDVNIVYGDIGNKDSLKIAMHDCQQVFHVAGFASDWGDYKSFYDVNVTGALNVADVALELGVKRMIQISSVAIHGFGFSNINEDHSFGNDLIAYAETKKIAEKKLFEFAKDTPLELTAIRPGNVFGENDHTFIQKYLDALFAGQLAYINKGKSLTCPTYVGNLVEGIYLASVKDNAVGEAFFITDGLDINWREFTGKLAKAVGKKPPTRSVPRSFALNIARMMESSYKALRIKQAPLLTKYRVDNGSLDYHFSIEKAKGLLGFEPEIDIDTALGNTAEWYMKSR